MRRLIIVLVVTMAAGMLVACSSSKNTASGPGAATVAAAKSNDPVEQTLRETAGNGATDCGRVKSQTPDEIKVASDCAMNAAQKKQAFYVAYDMPGLTVGVAGNAEGKLFSLSSEQPQGQAGAKVEAKTAPCPAELRVAGSGRVTCMTPAQGMMPGGGANPHGGMAMPSPTGENPHGAVGTKPGAANPHAGGAKIPPKQ